MYKQLLFYSTEIQDTYQYTKYKSENISYNKQNYTGYFIIKKNIKTNKQPALTVNKKIYVESKQVLTLSTKTLTLLQIVVSSGRLLKRF